ncbi:MAG: ATP-binding protein [Bacteroidota bacterium]
MRLQIPPALAPRTTFREARAPEFMTALRARPKPPPLGRWLLVSAGYILLYRLVFEGSTWLRVEEDFSLWYPPAGLDVALVAIFGSWFAPAVVINQVVLLSGWLGTPSVIASLGWGWTLVYALGQGVVYGGLAAVLLVYLGCNPRLRHVRDVTFFLVLMVVVAPALLGAWKVGIFVLTDALPASSFWPQLLGYTVGDGTGIALLVPVLAVLLRPFPKLWWDHSLRPSEGVEWSPTSKHLLELALTAAGSLAACWFIFAAQPEPALEVTYLLFAPIVWLAARYGMPGAALGALVVNLAAAFIVAPAELPQVNPYTVQFGMFTMTVIGLYLGAYVSSRRRSVQRMIEAVALTDQMNRTRQTMLMNLSEEVRPPLTAASRSVNALADLASSEQAALLATFKSSTYRLVRTLDRMTDFARVEAGEVKVEAETVDLAAVTRRLVAEAAPEARGKGIDLLPEIATSVRVVADPVLLPRTLRPLVGNAVAYTEKGFVTVRVSAEDGEGVCAVVDSGCGMTPENLRRAFEPFSDRNTDPDYPRLGIGLAIARGLAEAQGGRIDATSAPGVGSVFTLRLPLAARGL